MEQENFISDKKRIFLIEDHHKYVELIARAMQSDYNISSTDTAVKGLDVCKEFLPDIIILDINLVGNKSGLDLLKSIKGDETLAHIPVLIMSGISSSEIISDSLEHGANDYIVKPFEIKHLAYKVKNLLAVAQNAKGIEEKKNIPTPMVNVRYISNLLMQIDKIDDEAIFEKRMISVVDLSKKLGISQSTINRSIKKQLGITSNHYLIKRRLEKAKLLVVSNKWKQVNEIAFEMGFATSSYFCNCFKKYFGCSPSEMRLK